MFPEVILFWILQSAYIPEKITKHFAEKLYMDLYPHVSLENRVGHKLHYVCMSTNNIASSGV